MSIITNFNTNFWKRDSLSIYHPQWYDDDGTEWCYTARLMLLYTIKPEHFASSGSKDGTFVVPRASAVGYNIVKCDPLQRKMMSVSDSGEVQWGDSKQEKMGFDMGPETTYTRVFCSSAGHTVHRRRPRAQRRPPALSTRCENPDFLSVGSRGFEVSQKLSIKLICHLRGPSRCMSGLLVYQKLCAYP